MKKEFERRLKQLEDALVEATAPGPTMADWLAYYEGRMTEEEYVALLSADEAERLRRVREQVARTLADFADDEDD